MNGSRHIQAAHCGQGPRLVLLHGWTMTGQVMAPLARVLADRFACVAPDLPGHGGTTGYSADLPGAVAMLGDLLADGAPTVLVGWSLGALVGWGWLADDGPGAVRGMVSLDMSPRPLPAPDWPFGMAGQTAERIRARTGWFRDDWPSAVRPIAAGILSDGAPPEVLAPLAQVIAAQDGAVMADFWESLIEADLRAAIARLPVPLLAIHGAKSRVYSADSAFWLAKTAPLGAAKLIDGAGHAPHLEQTAPTVAAIADFAERIFAV